MKKLLLLGGTFDPPHNGHMSLLQAAVQAVRPDSVVVMPTGIPPHKEAGHTAAALRLQMCECFRPLFPALTVSDLEIKRAGKSFTVDTVRALYAQKRGADLRIYLPMGSDMLLYFSHWRDYETLLQSVTLVAHCRDKDDITPVEECAAALRARGGEVLLVRGQIVEVSSTEIRARAAAGQDISQLVPPPVAQLVHTHHLYENEASEAT